MQPSPFRSTASALLHQRGHRVALLAACLAAALAPTAAQADSGAAAVQATDLDSVSVTAHRATPETSAATGLALSPRETPQSVSIVTRERMDDFGLDSVNDVLNTTTGVTVEQVETDRTYYTARGFDITNFQLDGLGLPLPYGVQDGDIDTAMYERVEVLRGANGLMSSTGNPSATVNFIRKRPTDVFQGSASLTVGSWNLRRIDLDVSAPLNDSGTVRGRAVAAWQEDESHLDLYQRDKQLLHAVVEADLRPGTLLTAGASRQENRPNSPMWGALPLYYSDGSPTDYDVSTSTAADWSFWDTDDTRAFVELSQALAGDWQLRAAFNYQDKRQDTELFYVFGVPDAETGEGLMAYPSDYDGRFKARFFDVNATGTVELGGRAHDVVVGASSARGNNAEISWYSADIGTPIGPLEDFDGRYPKPPFDAFSDGSDFDYERDALYATVRWNPSDNLKIITGANRARVDTRGVSYGEPVNVEETRTTPFAGVVFDIATGYSLYGSYAEIFSQQSELDVDNRLVGPITGSNAELGLKGEWLDGGLNAYFAVFRARQDNLAEYAGTHADTGRSYYGGVDAESTGYEFDVSGRVGEYWQLSGGFTHLDLEGADGGDARSYIPRRLLRLAATARVPAIEGLKVGATARWQSDIHREIAVLDDHGDPRRINQEAYALFGLMASYDFAPGWNATLNIDNLTDEKYIQSLYWEQGFHGTPRNVSLSVGYRF